MIQSIYPHVFRNEYTPVPPEEDSPTIVTKDGAVLLREDGGHISFPTVRETGGPEGARFLFDMDGQAFFGLPEGMTEPLPEGCAYCEMSKLRQSAPKHLVFAGVTGWRLNKWYADNKFCGRCGSPTRHSDRERAMVCPACGNTVYPRIDPAVIIGVTDGDRLLLTKYSGRERYRRFALVAGYCETGETAEETVRREVMEEVGLRVRNIRYYKSQPWPFSGSMLFGFFCDVDGSREIRRDENELSVA